MNIKKLKTAVAGLVLLVSGLANAGIITFTDRSTYEAYINGAVLDDMLDITPDFAIGRIRSGYSWDISNYGCVPPKFCGDQSSQGVGDNNYIWTYTDGAFTFDENIFAFGFNFGSGTGLNFASEDLFTGDDLPAQVTLNGYASQQEFTGGFFGIASTDSQGFNVVNYTKSTLFGLFSQVTYATEPANAGTISGTISGTINAVPAPSTLAIFALGIMGLASRRYLLVNKKTVI